MTVEEIQEDGIYHFPEGIPAFEEQTRFRLLRDPALDPLLLLVSAEDEGLRFICVPAVLLERDYEFEIDETTARVLGVAPGTCRADGEELLCLAIIHAPESEPPCANLMAPVLIHGVNRVGLQAVQVASRWSCAHRIGPVEEQPC